MGDLKRINEENGINKEEESTIQVHTLSSWLILFLLF